MNLPLVLISTLVISALLIGGCTDRHKNPEKHAERFMQKITKQLDLSSEQKANLGTLKDEILRVRLMTQNTRADVHKNVRNLLNAPQLDQDKALSLVSQRVKDIDALTTLLLVLMLLHHATGKLFRPIETLKMGVERIGQGELDHRVSINRRDEFGELATSINAMADEIQQLLEAKRQLLLAISHELRSPITRAKVSLAMLENTSQHVELDRELNNMETLIEELLETERLNSQHQTLKKTEISLNPFINGLIEESFSDAEVNLQLPETNLVANVDTIRLKLLLTNLIENAIGHNTKDTKAPQITAEKKANMNCITVRDYGEGIEEECLPNLTEPFYRVDPARQRQTGGYGLGLYLCRMIAEAHNGSLEITSKKGSGTAVMPAH